MNRADKISMGQVMCLVFLGFLAMGADVLPLQPCFGAGAWLAPLILLPIMILGVYLLDKNRAEIGKKFLIFWQSTGGKFFGALVCIWCFVLLTVHGTRSALRMASTQGEPLFFGVLLLLLALFLVRSKLSAFARCGEIFAIILALTLGAVVILALPEIELSQIALITEEEVLTLPRFMLATLGFCSVGLLVLTFSHEVTERASDRRHVCWGLTWSHLALAVVLVLVLGVFGAPLAKELEQPFFQMVASLGTAGAFQRLEPLVSALWILGDLALLGLIMYGVKSLGLVAFKMKKPFVLSGFLLLLSIVFGGYLLENRTLYFALLQRVLPVGGLVFLVIMMLIYIKERGAKIEG